ncbi:MAG: DUF1624 domain-containing protein [Clostridia bacterium]|nr:DUF1624 domain-containing protein [Clostridia bacterium]
MEAPRYGKSNRIPLIDTVRGIMIFYVVIYHFLYDLLDFRLISPVWLTSTPMVIVHFVNFSIFISFSGISCRLSRSNWKRGLRLLGAAYLVTLVTWVMDHGYYVRFGILHLLGFSALLFWALDSLWGLLEKRLPALPARAVRIADVLLPLLALGLFFLTYFTVFSRTFPVEYLGWLGFRSPTYASSDYFPVIPFFFLYLFGAFVGKFIVAGRFPAWFYKAHVPFFDKVGKHTIWIYLLHQPVLYGLAWLIARLRG